MQQLSPASFNALSKYTRIISAMALVFMLFTGYTATGQVKAKKAETTTAAKSEKHSLTFEIIPSEQNSFGYNILDFNRKLVHQPSIPGLPGNKGFTKKGDAEKCAKLVISKINRNIMPPTVTKQEMDSLKIKF